jgi:3-methyl-2-oxobutanoate hydroxymethyltransferase
LEDAGCFSIVLELIPAGLGKEITESLSIPTIGIGAGNYTSGQVLVLQDMLGMNNEFNPKFLKKYINGFELLKGALNNYNEDVKKKIFPSEKESF